MSSSAARARSWWTTALGVGLSVACMYLALRGTDLRAIWSVLADANMAVALPLIATQFVFYAVKAIRWRWLLLPIRSASARELAAPMMIGFMVNNLLPARLGEIVRLDLGARQLRLGHAQVLGTLVIERLFDLIAVLALFAVAATGAAGVPTRLIAAGYVVGAAAIAVMGGVFAYVMWTRPLMTLMDRLTRPLPTAVARGVRHQLELGSSGLAALRDTRLLASIAVMSAVQWLLMGACIYLSFIAVGVQASFAVALIVLASTVFGVMVPAAPGYIGTLHLTFVFASVAFSIPAERALAAAVFYHIIPFFCVITAGGYYVRQTGLRLLKVRRDAVQTRLTPQAI